MTVDGNSGGHAGAGESLAAPALVRLPMARRGAGRLTVAAIAALTLHAAALAAVLVALDPPLGKRGTETNMVEISLVTDEALRSDVAGTATTAGGDLNLGEGPGGGGEADAAPGGGSTAPPEKQAELLTPADDSRLKLPPSAEGDIAAASREPAQQTSVPAAPAADNTAASVAGGASVIAADTVRETTAAPTASDGEINAYNQRVAVTLSKLKPKGVGETGLARIVFRIGSSGNVDDVRLASSTGKSKLDRLATDTVARAKFDTPPTGMTSAQLTYAVAFRFR